jgi:hypothetical protein
VHAILRRHGCSRLKPRLPSSEIVRYERERQGELVHVDIEKLGRIVVPGHRVTGGRRQRAMGRAGWQDLIVATDDATRVRRPPVVRIAIACAACEPSTLPSAVHSRRGSA